MQVVSLAQVSKLWWIVTLEESEQGWDIKQFKPAKGSKSKSLERAKQSAQSRSLPFVEIEFSKKQMEAIASLVQEVINRHQQRRLEKERRKNELRQHIEIKDANKAHAEQQLPPQPRQPVIRATPEQALLEKIQHLLQQLAATQSGREELKKQVSQLQEEVRNLSLRLTKD